MSVIEVCHNSQGKLVQRGRYANAIWHEPKAGDVVTHAGDFNGERYLVDDAYSLSAIVRSHGYCKPVQLHELDLVLDDNEYVVEVTKDVSSYIDDYSIVQVYTNHQNERHYLYARMHFNPDKFWDVLSEVIRQSVLKLHAAKLPFDLGATQWVGYYFI